MIIFGASGSVTRKLTEIGARHIMDGQNPISLCNVLFVGNVCALIVFLILHRRQLNSRLLKGFSRSEWFWLAVVAVLSGAVAPGLTFQALSVTAVNNVVLVGRLGPPLTLALSIFILKESVNGWQIAGALVSFLGVILTISLQPATANAMNVGSFQIGVGEFLAAVAAVAQVAAMIVSKKRLSRVPLGFYNIFRTGIGTVVFFIAAMLLYGPNHFANAFSPFLWRWMLLYGTVIVVVGQSLWIKGIKRSSVARSSLVSSFTPVLGLLFAFIILSELPTQAQYIGGSIILAGVALSQIGVQRKMSQSSVSKNNIEQQIEDGIGFKGM